MRRLVAKKRAASSKAAGVPCAVKRLCWSVPTKQEWVRTMEYLCKLKFLRVHRNFGVVDKAAPVLFVFHEFDSLISGLPKLVTSARQPNAIGLTI